MPAELHTTLPDQKGHVAERLFIERLVDLGTPGSAVWGNVDYLQGVADIDTVLHWPSVGRRSCTHTQRSSAPRWSCWLLKVNAGTSPSSVREAI